MILLVAAFLFFLPLGIHSHNEPDLWPKGIVKYHFDKTFSPENKTFMEDVLHKLGQKLEGCIMFKHSKSGNYIHVDTKYPCSSGLGYWGNSKPGQPQPMSLDPIHCLSESTVEHTFLHAIGVDHEHMKGGKGIESAKKMYKSTL